MTKQKKKRRCTKLFVALLSVLLAACNNPADPVKQNSVDDTPKTLAEIRNHEFVPVTVYRDPLRTEKAADLDPLEARRVDAIPDPVGTAWYPQYFINIEGRRYPYNGPAVVTRIDEFKTTPVSIPPLNTISTGRAFIKLVNASSTALILYNGGAALSPLESVSFAVSPGETAVYAVLPGSAAPYYLIKDGGVSLGGFPDNAGLFAADTVYSFACNGGALSPQGVHSLNIDNVLERSAGEYVAKALAVISAGAKNGKEYCILAPADETLTPAVLSYGGKKVTITLTGGETARILSLAANGSLFSVGDGVTLRLDMEITLMGRSNNTGSLVTVGRDAALIMNVRSTISDNTVNSSRTIYGAAVSIASGGTFTMNGGTISGNTVIWASNYSQGGGVGGSGIFIMNGGNIRNNSAYISTLVYDIGGQARAYGGGVCMRGGSFTMNGGTISGNSAISVAPSGSASLSFGGGVYAENFTMNGGTISGNSASSTNAFGGGVFANNFIMQGGAISGNTVTGSAYACGGGAAVYDGIFSKSTGGIISSQTAATGKAVYVEAFSSVKKRETTAGEGVTLDSRKSGAAGGWE
jgi:hypothetical protein